MAQAQRNWHGKKKVDEEDDEESSERGRGTWTGSVSFGLLQIPVTLYTAESRAEEVHFRQLDKKDMSPIKYERLNASTGKPVAWNDIVKGYEITRDEYVVLDPDDLKKANVKATQTIDIQDFVARDAIAPEFFETPYYLVPQKRASKAYVLLRRALEKKNAVAIATFVMRTREHLCAIMPVGDALVCEVLRFGHELKPAAKMGFPKAKDDVNAREIAMAEQLVEGMMTEWDPAKYKDRYYADVMKMLKEKAKTGVVRAHNVPDKTEVASDVTDLLELLKKSVASNDHGKKHVTKTTKTTKAPRAKKGRAA